MYAQITIDCQTKTDLISCEYCIANKTCQFHANLERGGETNSPINMKTEQLTPLPFIAN